MRAVLHGVASQPWRRLRSRSFLHAAVIIAQLGRALGRCAARRIMLVAFFTASINAGKVAWASPEIGKIHRHEALHVLVVRFRQRVSQRNVDDFDVGFGKPAVLMVRIADGIELAPRISDFQKQSNVGLGH